MENYIWTMIMASWTPLIIHDSYELQTSMISDHSKWGFIRFTRSMITHDCYEHWLWAITVHRNSYEFGFWTINDQTHHTWWGGINAMKCWCSYMINTDSVSYYDPYDTKWYPVSGNQFQTKHRGPHGFDSLNTGTFIFKLTWSPKVSNGPHKFWYLTAWINFRYIFLCLPEGQTFWSEGSAHT